MCEVEVMDTSGPRGGVAACLCAVRGRLKGFFCLLRLTQTKSGPFKGPL
jgi:hypothetical protein